MNSGSVGVIFPVYNAAAFVGEALASILGQSFTDFEVLAIDDGSTDGSFELLNAAARTDRRVRLLRQPNAGLVATLNRGLDTLTGERRVDFVARMDADDVSLPERFGKQTRLLAEHGDVAGCGTWIETLGAGEPRVWEHPTDPDAVAAALLFRNPVAHPSVMLRRQVFDAGLRYAPAARHCEDWALWAAITTRSRLTNVGEVLLRYRVHAAQVGAVHRVEQRQNLAYVWRMLLARLGIEPTSAELAVHGVLAFDTLESTPAFVDAAVVWLRGLLAANTRARGFPAEAFGRVLTGRYVAVVRRARAIGIELAPWASPFAQYLHENAI